MHQKPHPCTRPLLANASDEVEPEDRAPRRRTRYTPAVTSHEQDDATRSLSEPLPEGTALLVRCGGVPGYTLRLKAAHSHSIGRPARGVVDVAVPRFERVGIVMVGTLSETKKLRRFFELEPGSPDAPPSEYAFGPFFIRGVFRIIRKVNHPIDASDAWKAFEAR